MGLIFWHLYVSFNWHVAHCLQFFLTKKILSQAQLLLQLNFIYKYINHRGTFIIQPPTHHRRISYLISLKSGQRVGRQSVDSWPSVGRLSAVCRPTVDRLPADCRPTRWPTCLPTRRWDRTLYLYQVKKEVGPSTTIKLESGLHWLPACHVLCTARTKLSLRFLCCFDSIF